MSAIVYRFYDRDGRLLYVGMTTRGAERWVEHAHLQAWWPDVAYVRVEHLPTRDDAVIVETNAIRNENPLHNLVRLNGTKNGPRPMLYRRWHEGSVFLAKRGTWEASVWYEGKKHRFYGGYGERGKAKAERLLAEFRDRYGIVAINA